MTPCSPAIAFCSIVGHAIFQTAGPMGPSTSERSKVLRTGADTGAKDYTLSDRTEAPRGRRHGRFLRIGEHQGDEEEPTSRLPPCLRPPPRLRANITAS